VIGFFQNLAGVTNFAVLLSLVRSPPILLEATIILLPDSAHGRKADSWVTSCYYRLSHCTLANISSRSLLGSFETMAECTHGGRIGRFMCMER
jgi:hypothetical protein